MAKKESTKTFVLRIDAETMSAIEAWAEDEFRSVNGQILWALSECLKKNGRLKKAKRTNKPSVTEKPDGLSD